MKSYHAFKAADTSYGRARARFLTVLPMWVLNGAEFEQFGP